MSFSAQYPPVLTEAGDLTSEVLGKYNQEFQYLYTNLLSTLFSATTGHAHTGNGSDGAQLTANSIANDAITTLKILNEAVTEAKLATDAVTTLKILDAAITTAKFAEDAKCPLAGTADLATNATTAGKVANALTINGTSYDGSSAKSLTTTAVSITAGTIANGGTIPLPSGYTREQCKYAVWFYNYPTGAAGDWSNINGVRLQVDQTTGLVSISYYVNSWNVGTDFVAGYLCIGVK